MSSLFKKTQEQYCERGLAAFSQKRLKEAEVEFSKGLRHYPASFALLANRANVWFLQGDLSRAVQDLTDALKAAPSNPSSWAIKLKRGTWQVQRDLLDVARRDLDEALSEAPSDADRTLLASGHFYRALAIVDDQPIEAIADARKAVEFSPNDGRYRKLLADLETNQTSPEASDLGRKGVEYYQSGEMEKALDCFERLLALEPEHAKGWQLKGAVLHQLHRYDEELLALNRSYQINGNEVALFNRGTCLVALGRIEEARRDMLRFVEVGTHAETVKQAQLILSKLG